ncbi:hypothetical protein BH09BAC5_BH09BAC5_17800 [soil metagenome]
MTTNRSLRITLYLAIFFQILFAVVFASFIFRAFSQLNHLPTPYNPDPRDLGFSVHYAIVFYFILTIKWITLSSIIFSSWLYLKKEIAFAKFLFFLGISALILLWFYIDPYNLIGWLLD